MPLQSSTPSEDPLTVCYISWPWQKSEYFAYRQDISCHEVLLQILCVVFCVFTRADVELSIEDFNRIGDRVPLIANLKPHGKVGHFLIVDFFNPDLISLISLKARYLTQWLHLTLCVMVT